MLTLEDFKAARAVLHGIIRSTDLIYSPPFPRAAAIRSISSLKICRSPALTKFAAPAIRSAP